MTFLQAVTSGYANSLNFRGRAPRSAYWYWLLFQIIVGVLFAFVEGGGHNMMGQEGYSGHYEAGPIAMLWHLANLLPGLALSMRRLHDLDKSGWWCMIALVPLIGWIVLLAWFANRGTAGANRFGADPLA